ncbi:MAG: hypothetical protein DRI81_19265 [Chloroflexi bacterium]|nr:MAG: hypothetical protein DRI81_19265 [Chloroflexota bacterium]
MAEKVVVIGLDGADWRLIEPWIESGDLPTLSRLVSEGATGRLRSTIRPESSVAWSSFSTGVNPGQHGVFGFAERAGTGYAFRLANGSSVRARRFWDILGEQGLKVGLLNIPFTYPPAPVNGFLVTGMLTPGPDVAFTYPRELGQRLLNRFEDYVFDAGDSTQDKAALIESARAHTQQQRETALFLLQEEAWDFFALVLTGPDRLQHFLWADVDDQHPFHDPATSSRFGSALLEHYRALDDAVAEIMTRLPPDTLVLLMSDHGFNGCARRFYVNRWLRDQGWLTLRESGDRRGLAPALSHLGSVRWLRRLKRALLPARWSSLDLRSRMFAQAVDWSSTKAYFGMDGGLRVNVQGREPEGIVPPGEYDNLRHELRQALLTIRDPETKQLVLAEVFLREELYRGPFAGAAPDLILEPQRDKVAAAYNFVLDSALNPDGDNPFGSSLPYSGNHTLDGILIAWGADVSPGRQVQNAKIIDLAPIVLAALDVAIPEYMNGRALSEIFAPGCAPAPRYAESESNAMDKPERAFSRKEERTVENRLSELGYLA